MRVNGTTPWSVWQINFPQPRLGILQIAYHDRHERRQYESSIDILDPNRQRHLRHTIVLACSGNPTHAILWWIISMANVWKIITRSVFECTICNKVPVCWWRMIPVTISCWRGPTIYYQSDSFHPPLVYHLATDQFLLLTGLIRHRLMWWTYPVTKGGDHLKLAHAGRRMNGKINHIRVHI